MTQLLFVQNYPPHGTIKGQEVLDACLMGSAFADCALLFLGDGLYQLIKHQQTTALGLKDYSVSYGVLADYGVEKVYCRQEDLAARGLVQEDLVIEVEPLSAADLKAVLATAKQVLTF